MLPQVRRARGQPQLGGQPVFMCVAGSSERAKSTAHPCSPPPPIPTPSTSPPPPHHYLTTTCPTAPPPLLAGGTWVAPGLQVNKKAVDERYFPKGALGLAVMLEPAASPAQARQ